jgi:hypothetical protein
MPSSLEEHSEIVQSLERALKRSCGFRLELGVSNDEKLRINLLFGTALPLTLSDEIALLIRQSALLQDFSRFLSRRQLPTHIGLRLARGQATCEIYVMTPEGATDQLSEWLEDRELRLPPDGQVCMLGVNSNSDVVAYLLLDERVRPVVPSIRTERVFSLRRVPILPPAIDPDREAYKHVRYSDYRPFGRRQLKMCLSVMPDLNIEPQAWRTETLPYGIAAVKGSERRLYLPLA